MNNSDQPDSKQEGMTLAALQDQYRSMGYEFIANPGPKDLPEFFAGFKPDAVALKEGDNVAIEIKHNRTASAERKVQDIRRLISGHGDWALKVFYIRYGSAASYGIDQPTVESLKAKLAEIEAMSAAGFDAAAFLMSWSLLEATARTLSDDSLAKAQRPATVVQHLAQLGLLEPPLEGELRSLIETRNRIAHGDVSIAPDKKSTAILIGAIRNLILEAEARSRNG